MFWGCFGCFGMFRMFWGVLDKLLHFNLNIRLCCEQLGGGYICFGEGCFAHMGHRTFRTSLRCLPLLEIVKSEHGINTA